MTLSPAADLQSRCDLLRSLHRPGAPLLLPNAWDVVTARAVAARIARGVDVPVTVYAEAGYGMQPAELVAALRSTGAAGCNLEDTDHAAGTLRDPEPHAEWLRAVRQAASDDGYRLVINARVDVFLVPFFAGA